MPTIIDELVVNLGINVQGMQQGQQQAMGIMVSLQAAFRRHGQELERTSTNIVHGFSGLRLSWLALIDVARMAFDAIEHFAVDQAKIDTSIGRTAFRLGQTIPQFDLWRQAMENFTEGGGKTFQASLEGITQTLQQWELNGIPPEMLQWLNAANIHPVDEVTHRWKNALDIAKEAAAFTTKMGYDESKAQAFGAKIGIDKDTMFALRHPELFNPILDKTQELGILTKEQYESAQRIYTAWSETQQAITNAVRELRTEFEPQIKEVLTAAQGITKEIKGWIEEMKEPPPSSGFFGWLNDTMQRMHNFAQYMHDLWPKIGTAIKNALSPLISLLEKLGIITPGSLNNLSMPEIEGTMGYRRLDFDERFGASGELTPVPPSFLGGGAGAGTGGGGAGAGTGGGGGVTVTPQNLTPPPGSGSLGGIDRSSFFNEINSNPALFQRAATMVAGEVGTSAPLDTQRTQLETAFNRAWADRSSLTKALQTYTGPGSGGYYPPSTYAKQVSPEWLEKFKTNVWDPVLKGSDTATRGGVTATGNASSTVALHQFQKGTPGYNALAAGGQTESYFNERVKKLLDRPLPRLTDTAQSKPSAPVGSTAAQSINDRWGATPLAATPSVAPAFAATPAAVPALTDTLRMMRDSAAAKPNLRQLPEVSTGAAGLTAAQSISDRWGGSSSTTNNATNTNNISTVNIHTQASDAIGIAQDFGKELDNYSFANQANGGPQ